MMNTQLYSRIKSITDSTPNDLDLGRKIREIIDKFDTAVSVQELQLLLSSNTGEHIEYPSSTIITLSKDKLKND